MLVITSDRGMCGAYNANVLRVAMAAIRAAKAEGDEVVLEGSGRKGHNFFKFQKLDLANKYNIGDKPKYEDVEAIASRYIAEFTEGKYDSVSVGYMKFISNSRQTAEVLQLLPLKTDAAAASAADAKKGESAAAAKGPVAANYEFSPSSTELLGALLPLTVKTALFQAFYDAVVSEQIMKMVAMKSATENAKDVGRDLKRSYNRIRQTRITTELTEIVSGAAALE
jgi:F-type H+-transporting ATPase subunit gamma